jgi:hypothetical protein
MVYDLPQSTIITDTIKQPILFLFTCSRPYSKRSALHKVLTGIILNDDSSLFYRKNLKCPIFGKFCN